MPLYNLACAESLAGHPEDAIRHLGMALELAEAARVHRVVRGGEDSTAHRRGQHRFELAALATGQALGGDPQALLEFVQVGQEREVVAVESHHESARGAVADRDAARSLHFGDEVRVQAC